MKLLIVTQKVNINDPILGFFHRWIIEFSKHCEKITVICLEKGEFYLPVNVKVLSLGKENGVSKIKYLVNFYKYIWRERKNYDAVFVHMNQEYILLAGFWWRLIGKKVFMWRNHNAGSWLTDLAAFFCTKVFCTSKYSYTAKYKKTVLMPVGVDTEIFKPDPNVNKIPHSILFLARMSPAKKPHILIEALKFLKEKKVEFVANFYGDPALSDQSYYENLKQKVVDYGLDDRIIFHKGIPNRDTVAIYNQHKIFVNLSSSGMYDKTIFEAMACGCVVLTSNENLSGEIDGKYLFEQDNINNLIEKLSQALFDQDLIPVFYKIIERHNLKKLAENLFAILN